MKIQLFLRFARYLKKYWGKELILLFLMMLSSAAALVSPYILKIIIDKVFPTRDFHLLIQVLLIMLGVNIFRLFISFTSDYLFAWISNHITRDIRMDLFNHLMKLPISFFNKNKVGDLVHRVNSEVNSIQSILTGTLVRLVDSACTILGLGVMLCILNYKLFLISMIVMPFIFINTRSYQPRIQKTVKLSHQKDADILSYLMERFANVKLIKSYDRFDFEQSKFSDKIEEQIDLNLKNVKLTRFTRNITTFFTMLVPLLVLGIGGKQVMAGTMTVGALVAFIQYMNRIFDPFRNLMGLYFDTIRAVVSMQRIFDIENVEIEELGGEIDVSLKEDIIFRNISFQYDNLPVLQGVNFTFHQGKKYALVGGSGCGKSTLISLLCRFYPLQEGEIYIEDKNINSLHVQALRRRIALVTQDNQLFHESIEDNIRYGNSTCSADEIEYATCCAGIDKHIKLLPEGFNTIIGDRGAGLSGGQQQRIAIARAIIKDADIILLDEATSALDSDSEKNILEGLCNLYTEKTIMVISHRLSAIKGMDEIVCLDKGRIVENGNHDQLIAQKGFYWELFRKQIE